jgi:hypothetical protein
MEILVLKDVGDIKDIEDVVDQVIIIVRKDVLLNIVL